MLIRNFSLKATIECGQFFNYKPFEKGYIVINGQDVFYVEQRDNELIYEGTTKEKIEDFFQLNVKVSQPVRVIKQDPWQCIVSYICSSASNVKKIQKNIFLLSEFFGKKVKFKGKTFYTFPKISKINNLEKITQAKTGYRAKYILAANKIVNNAFLKSLKQSTYQEAKNQLIQIPGIADKVSDCICLFSLEHHQAFPLDVWIKRHTEEMGWQGNYKQLSQKAIEHYGPFAGWTQQEIYHKIRL